MDLQLEAEDRDQPVRKQKLGRVVFNCLFRFRSFASSSIPVGSPWLVVLLIFASGLCLWGYLNSWLLPLFWPSLLEYTFERSSNALMFLPGGLIVGILFYWLFGGLIWVAALLAGLGLGYKSVRHIVLFAGVPMYLVAFGVLLLSLFINLLGVQPLKLGGINDWTVGNLIVIGFIVVLLTLAIITVLRLHSALRGENGTTFSSFCIGIVLPIIMHLSFTWLTRNPSFVTQIMADNIEKAMHENMSVYGPVAPRRFVTLGVDFIPKSDKLNHLRFAYMGVPWYGLDLTRGTNPLDYLDSLRNEAPRDSRVYQQIRAEIGLRREDYQAAVRGYSNLIQRDSNELYYRSRLVQLLLKTSSEVYDPQGALLHVLYLRRAEDKRLYELLYGACLYHLGRYPEAYDVLYPLTESDPSDSPTLFLTARTCAELGRYDMALRLLDQTVNSEERNEWFVQSQAAFIDELRELITELDQEDSFDQ